GRRSTFVVSPPLKLEDRAGRAARDLRRPDPGRPPEWLARRVVTQDDAGNLLRREHELELEFVLVAAVEAGQLAQPRVGITSGEKALVLIEREWSDTDADATLWIPDLVPDYRASPQAGRGAGSVLGEGTEIVLRQRVPSSLELTHLDGHAEIVLEELLQRHGASLRRGEQTSIENERLLLEGQVFAGRRKPHPHQVQQMLSKGIALLPHLHRHPVFLPRPVEEGEDPVVEQIQEVAEGRLPDPASLDGELGVVMRQNSLRPDQPQKVHPHRHRS